MNLRINPICAMRIAMAVLPRAACYQNLAEDECARANAALVGFHALSRYRQLEIAMTGFSDATRGYCSAPSESGAQVVRERFRTAMDAWFAIERARFGPTAYFNRLHFWPGAKVAARSPKIDVLQMTGSESRRLHG